MLLTTVVLVLTETLEAAMIVSMLLAWSLLNGYRRRWIGGALLTGLAGSALYAAQAATVSDWFDYAGMEVVNAGMHFGVCMALLVIAVLPRARRIVMCAMLLAVVFAMVREGFEILLYLSGFVADRTAWSTVVLGSVMGVGIGVSIGALLFYMVVGLTGQWARRMAQLLIALSGGNMAAQGTLLLIQADWVAGGLPLWNTSHLLAEDSLPGQLLYALIGYEATPYLWQAVAYCTTFCVLSWLFLRSSANACLHEPDESSNR